MSKTIPVDTEYDEMTRAGAASDDPAYLAWRDAKVREALSYAKAHPEEMISEEDIWKKFGLKY